MTSLSPTIRQIQPFYRNLYQTSGKKPENIESGEAALLSSKAVLATFKNQRLPGFQPTPLCPQRYSRQSIMDKKSALKEIIGK